MVFCRRLFVALYTLTNVKFYTRETILTAAAASSIEKDYGEGLARDYQILNAYAREEF